jgi:hypothetical protein
MVYVNLKGRLGNNLFQLAAASSLAHLHNTDFAAIVTDYWCSEPDHCYLEDYLKQFKTNILSNVHFTSTIPKGLKEFNEQNSSFSPISFQKEILLNGWFQSEKYFVDSVVRELFNIDQKNYDYIKGKYGHLLLSDNTITSIHVRRGDYLKLPHQYSICSMRYFEKAIDLIGRDKKYMIISDDINWCKRHFRGPNFYFVENESPLIDLYLQAFCTNNIISNSTFSWWGAWLNKNPDKLVVAPTPWVGKFHKHVSTKDLIPEKWIQIKNPLEVKYKLRVIQTEIKGIPIEIREFLVNIISRIKRKIKAILQMKCNRIFENR